LVGEAVDGATAGDELPIRAGGVHLLDEGVDLCERHVRIERAVADQNGASCRLSFGGPRCDVRF
jgi:hypothetical protein